MAIRFTESASKLAVPSEDELHAMLNAEGSEDVTGRPGEVKGVFVGHSNAQKDRYIEVIAAQRGSDLVIFHVMPLSDLYRHLLRRNT